MLTFRIVLLLFAAGLSLAHAENAPPPQNPAAPIFSQTGPDADAYGATEGYPKGPPGTSQLKYLVAGYSRFDEVAKSRKIAHAAALWPFKRAVMPAVSYRFNGEQFTIADYLNRNPVTGLLIAKDDTILYETYQYARTDRDRFLSQSMAKTITSMLVGIAVSEGKIGSIDDPVSAYLPGLSDTEYGKTSLRDLLHMASGVAFTEEYDGADDISKLAGDLFGNAVIDPVTSVAQFNTRTAPPGRRFHYASVETEILGLVLRAATGVPVADYLHEKIWKEIGTEADASWAIDRTGQEVTFCCFNAVLRDYARFGRLLAHDGAWEGRQIVPRQWILDASTVRSDDNYLAPKSATPYFGYGYQVWLLPGPQRDFALLGIRGQIILIDPATKLVMVHTAVRAKPSEPESYAETLALWFAVLAHLGK